MSTVKVALPQSRTAPLVSAIEIDGVADETMVVRSMELEHTPGNHSVANIRITTVTKNVVDYKTLPVFFRFGSYPRYGYFWGYVQSATKAQPFKDGVSVSLGCYGYTFKMRTSGPRFWSNSSPRAILQTLTSDHGLGVYYDDPQFTVSRMAQTEETDWQMANRAAHAGSRMLCPWNGGVLRAVDPVVELSKNTSMGVYEKSTNVLDPPELSLMDFTAGSEDDNDPREMLPAYSYFAADSSVKKVKPSGDRVDLAHVTNKYVDSENSSQRINYVSKQVSEIDDYATARIRGDGVILPGTVIGISTGTSKYSNTDSTDGLWFVAGVRHKADETLFQTELRLMRDKFRPNNDTRYEPLRGDRRSDPRMVLSNGEWVSTWR